MSEETPTVSSDVPPPAPEVPPPPPPPAPVSLADLLSATEVVQQKELADKATLESIGSISIGTLRTALIAWAAQQFPNAWPLQTVTVTPPAVCSDGVARSLEDYIAFCSGKTIAEHVAVLQEKVTSDIQIGFANLSGSIAIVVTKA